MEDRGWQGTVLATLHAILHLLSTIFYLLFLHSQPNPHGTVITPHNVR
jgi:hypothetical protein